MDLTQKHSRRNMLKTGLAAATAAALPTPGAKAQQRGGIHEEWTPKKPGTIRISAITGEGDRERNGLYSITSHLPNADFWWARNTRPITPEMLHNTDLLLTYYSGYLYSDENVEIIIDDITNRGMAWIMIHNTPWFCGDKLNAFTNAYPMLHREIQPVIIRNLNQEHPITKGIEPFIIQLDEQFGAYIADPDDPNFTLLFKSQGVHDQHITIQGWCVQRGKGRIVGLTPGHYEWTWYQVQYQEIVWRAAQWALNLPIEPFYGNFDNFIW
ncbi:MAG: ThuA domain-containing protein [Candidatus Latescibacteria bacterium]|nr:ThuA domain-containing protein [Candidatus Latescibacterota bacterium]